LEEKQKRGIAREGKKTSLAAEPEEIDENLGETTARLSPKREGDSFGKKEGFVSFHSFFLKKLHNEADSG